MCLKDLSGKARDQQSYTPNTNHLKLFFIYIFLVVEINLGDTDTLRISGVSELGPLEEKYATLGAGGDFPITVLLASICTTGFLGT